jgi:hypothetical protein
MHEPSTSKPSNDPTRPPSRLRRNSVSAQPPPTSSHAPLEKKPQTFLGMNMSMRGSTTSLATAKEAPVAIQRRQRTQSLTKKNSPATMSRPNLSWPMSAAQKEEPQSPREPLRRRIMFYEWTRPYYCFTNFSPHPVTYKGKTYPTSEHLFQSFKVSIFVCLARYDGNIEYRLFQSFLVSRSSAWTCRTYSVMLPWTKRRPFRSSSLSARSSP